ncbi:AraC family transcriptional regulator [Paenibacillus sp. PL91]|uniref:AraC family transcriptional regulator n=1 Tax=Paenibacillus sp. PL91 TaxID=2729538 RepID=UPI00145F5BD2|nr:AraC family transcriptional regulator [Paenibacillus sp. PL91]MBC9201190.1 helix-turn-helix transcriptional regulator [Paenibacillus sp. PL91]
MKVFGFYKSKKYLQRVMFSITASMVVVLALSAVSNTYILEKSVKGIQEESNLKVLSQIQYNLSYMNDIITRLSNFVYRDHFLIPLMFNDELPKMDFIRGHRQMSNIMESSSFLHSMVVYNKARSELYGTSSSLLLDGGITEKKIRSVLMDPNHPQPTNRLIPMSLEKDDGRIDTFAFIVTDSLKSFTSSQSAIILFIKSDWVFESLKKMNVASSRDQGEIYIQTQNGQLLTSDPGASYMTNRDQNRIKEIVQTGKATEDHSAGFVIDDQSEEKEMITYMDDGLGAWTILFIQSYDKMMEEVTKTRNQSLMISGLFLLLAVGFSIWLSYKLYNPIENMLKRIRPHLPDERSSGKSARDELGLMSDNYMRLSEKLNEISSEQIVSKYYIRRFLTDSQLFSHHDMQHLIEKHELNISVKDELLVCVMKIDNFAIYDNSMTGSTKKLYNFAIVNIAQEMMSRHYPCEAVEVRGDHVVLILSRSMYDENMLFEQVPPLLREIQDTIERYYSISLSCGISDVISQYPFLSAAYTQALRLSQYMIVKGHKSIITAEDIQMNLASKQMSLPDAIERKLVEALKKGQLTNVGTELEKAFSLIAGFNYDDMVRTVSNLAWVIKNAVSEISDNRLVAFHVDIDYIHQIAQEKETLEEMYLSLLSLCAKICEGQRPANMERNEMMLETVKELIEQKFSDINLSQQSIATSVKLSSAYIGKLFKESYKLSITEYINEVRLNHAKALLEQNNYTIAEIMDKCGYANQSYFFRLFKGKVGTTPKEYRMKKSIS